ncbi:MAG: cyclic nucleotide-binding domain-containing protein [Planctomycetes bacterium]|nr:cyclic nucleotide-binding domain-containing protein [Planctomycetota bacterium]
MNDELLQKLVATDLFRGMAGEDVRSLMAHAAVLTVAADQPVFEAGAQERALYVLLEGSVEIALTVPFVQEQILDELNAVSVFGESSFFHAGPHSVTVRSLTECTIARLERADYDQLLVSNNPTACRMGANAAEILAAKLQRTDAWITELLQTEEAHRIQQKWWDFRQNLGHAFDNPTRGGFSVGAGLQR